VVEIILEGESRSDARLFAGTLECDQDNRGKHPNDRDYYQEFDESETAIMLRSGVMHDGY
jgi:hypothetical protein